MNMFKYSDKNLSVSEFHNRRSEQDGKNDPTVENFFGKKGKIEDEQEVEI